MSPPPAPLSIAVSRPTPRHRRPSCSSAELSAVNAIFAASHGREEERRRTLALMFVGAKVRLHADNDNASNRMPACRLC